MQITANALQTVKSGGDVVFTDTPIPGNCSIIHREGFANITLRGLANGQCRARFKVSFNGNISPSTGETPAQLTLVLSVDGENIGPTRMMAFPSAVGQFSNVSAHIFLDVPVGCCTHLNVKNISTIPIDLQNANLIVERVA